MIKGIRINKSKVVHLYWEAFDRTDCGAGGMSDISANGGVPTEDAVTCKRCLKAIEVAKARHAQAVAEHEEMVALVEGVQRVNAQDAIRRAHAEALEMNAAVDARRAAARIWDIDEMIEALQAVVDREPVAPTRKQRRAHRRAQRATLRRMTPQLRAAGCARRAQRGAARATAKTLLVASGVPQDVAKSYAPAFSKGSGAEKVKTRVRKGDTARTKRTEVMRYTWPQFTARLEQYRPADALGRAAVEFRAARERVLA